MTASRTIPLGLLLLIPACMVGPDYERPDIPLPDSWHQQLQEGLSEGEAALHVWWTVFNDSTLEELIRRSGTGNLDLKIAYARIQEARALRGVAAGALVPDLNANAGIDRQKIPAGSAFGLGSITGNMKSLGVSSSWELDVWGRIRRSVESADATVQATVEDYRDVLVLMYAEIALNYLELRALQLRITYAKSNLEGQQKTLSLTKDRHEADLVPELDVKQAEYNLARTEAIVPSLRIREAQVIHRLAVLLGEYPEELSKKLRQTAPLPKGPDSIGLTLPHNLIRQRPDVRGAERQLAAQTARIGVATAELYPKFTLDGFFNYASFGSGSLFSSGNEGWGVGLPIQWSLFSGGAVQSQIEAEKARTDQALEIYKRSLLLAVEEVENAIVGFVEQQKREASLLRSVAALQRSVELVQNLYKNGLTNFQNVLDMERALFEEQDRLAEIQGLAVQALVVLYSSLGGGWDPDAAEAALAKGEDPVIAPGSQPDTEGTPEEAPEEKPKQP